MDSNKIRHTCRENENENDNDNLNLVYAMEMIDDTKDAYLI